MYVYILGYKTSKLQDKINIKKRASQHLLREQYVI